MEDLDLGLPASVRSSTRSTGLSRLTKQFSSTGTGVPAFGVLLVWIRIRILLFIDLQDANKKLIFFKVFLLSTFTSFSKIKSQKEVTKR
jgi:hypothetical protein